MGFVCWKRHLARPDDKSQRLKEKEMTFVRSIAVVFGAALVILFSFGQDDHQAHHPAGSSAPGTSALVAPSFEGMPEHSRINAAWNEQA